MRRQAARRDRFDLPALVIRLYRREPLAQQWAGAGAFQLDFRPACQNPNSSRKGNLLRDAGNIPDLIVFSAVEPGVEGASLGHHCDFDLPCKMVSFKSLSIWKVHATLTV